MSNTQRRVAVALACAGIAVLVSAACGGSGSTTTSPATTTVTMSDPATCAGPNGPFSHVYVSVSDVQASTSGGAGASFVDLTPSLAKSPMQIDLLGQANNQCLLATLGSTTQLQPGNYQQIRLILVPDSSAATVSGNQCGSTAANCVVLNSGAVVPLQLSSQAQTGIKIPSGQIAGGQFVVAAGQTKDLNLDFNTCASIVTQGNGGYRLDPVLHAGEISTTSTSINGTVVDKATGQPLTGGNVMVALEQKDSAGVDRVVMTTDADTSGHFVFCPVPAGTYDVVAVGVNGSGVGYAATVTTGVTVGTAMGNVPLVAESGGQGTAPATITGSVTTTSGTAAIAEDVTLSALQTASVGTGSLTFTMPLVQQLSATLALTTASGGTCPANADCAAYSLSVPGAAANAGVFAASGTNYVQASGSAAYSVEADAVNCSPSSATTADTSANIALTLGPGATAQAATLALAGCQ
jgi:hypothetical protein